MLKKLTVVVICVAAFGSASPVHAVVNPDRDRTKDVPEAVVALHFANDTDPRTQFCTGTIISNRWVLTAGHCLTMFDRADQLVVVANRRIGRNEVRFTVEVEKIAVHPGYSYKEGVPVNDVGLVLMKSKIPGVSPIRLIGNDDTAALADPNGFMLYGWGISTQGRLPVRPLAVRQYLRTDGIEFSVGAHLAALNVTASGRTQGSCNGDSGGPVVSYTTGSPRIVAIVSYGVSDCLAPVPGVNTKIAPVRSWLLRAMGR